MGREGIADYEQIMDCQILDKYNLTDRKVPAITVKGNQVRFNMNAIHLLKDVQYVQLLINREEKYMLVIPCNQNDVFSIEWCKTNNKTKKVEPKDITSKFLSPKLYKLMDWDLEYSYKIQCFYQDFGEGKMLLFFDLTEFVTLVPTEQRLADGTIKKRSKPYYLANWEDSFGPPLKNLLNKVMRDYSGYYALDENGSSAAEIFELAGKKEYVNGS